MFRAFVAVTALAGCASSAFAQRDMGCSPTLANPCTGGVPGGRPGDHRGPEDSGPAARLNELSRRFAVLLSGWRAYDVPNTGDLHATAAPQTLEELSRRVDRLYVESAFHHARLAWRSAENQRRLDGFPVVLADLRADVARLQDRLLAAPERLRGTEAARDIVVQRAAREERVVALVRSNADVVAGDLAEAQGRAQWPIFELLPAHLKAGFHEQMRKGKALSVYARQKPEDRVIPVRAVVVPPRVVGQPVNMAGPLNKPPPLGGSVEDRLLAFDGLKAKLDQLGGLLPDQERRLAELRRQAKEIDARKESLLARVAAYESPLEKAQQAIDDAERRIAQAQADQATSAGELLRLAAAAVVWEHLRNTIVIPQVEEVLRANGLLRGLKGVALLDQIRKRPQDFVPKAGPFKELPRLIETAKKIVAVEENAEHFMLAAAAASAQRGTVAGDVLVAHVFQSLEEQGTEIMRTASGTVEGPLGRIARAIVNRAPRR